jgi:hypothetical protein
MVMAVTSPRIEEDRERAPTVTRVSIACRSGRRRDALVSRGWLIGPDEVAVFDAPFIEYK